jgi:hypothetical protein
MSSRKASATAVTEAERVEYQNAYWTRQAANPTPPRELAEQAWAGGFFDGEGHGTMETTPDRLLERSPVLRLTIDQGYGADGRANLERFQAVLGAGSIRLQKPRCEGRDPVLRYILTGEAKVLAAITKLLPHVGPAKFAQLRALLDAPVLSVLRNEALGRSSPKARPNIIVRDVKVTG